MKTEEKEKKYTTQLQAGLGILNETKLLLDIWEPGMESKQLREKALSEGFFPNVSARRLKNIVDEAFATRYLVEGQKPAKYVSYFKENLSREAFKQITLLYTCRANLILKDFIRFVYWPKYGAGVDTITRDDSRRFVMDAVREGYTQNVWADSTIKRVSSYLLGACGDFGLLENSKGYHRKILSFRIESEMAAFLAYELHFSGIGDNSVISDSDWEIYGLKEMDVKELFKQMALQGHLIFQSTAKAVKISWKYEEMDELLNVITE
mgnify:CR=1 FL=1